jgi:NTP pyrophosphatase (non-canonical NTP hydrolase)
MTASIDAPEYYGYRGNTRAIMDVLAERVRQDKKWGEQNNDPFTYLAVLGEEFGEVCQAALHLRFGGHAADDLRMEAVHVAAVALAIVECLDRNKWKWGVYDSSES